MSVNSDIVNALDTFCRPLSVFWNLYETAITNATINESISGNMPKSFDEVDFPLCFQDMVFFNALSLVFLVMVIFRFVCRERKLFRIGFTWLNITKLMICILLIAPSIAEVGYGVWQARWVGVGEPSANTSLPDFPHIPVAPVEFLTPCIFIIDMILCMLLILRERQLGLKSSGVQFIFWLALLIYEVFHVRSYSLIHLDNVYIREDPYLTDWIRFGTTIFRLVGFLVQFLLALLPDKEKANVFMLDDQPCPELKATFLSQITWWWLNGLIFKGYKRALEYSDLWNLNPDDKSDYVGPKFERAWEKELKKANIDFAEGRTNTHQGRKSPSLVMALARTCGYTFMVAALFKFLNDTLTFVNPQLLKLIIQYVSGHSKEDAWKGYVYAVLMFVTAVIQSLILHQYFIRCFLVGMRLRTGVIYAVYRKALRLSSLARRDSTTGEIVNLMAIDAQRFMDLATYVHMLWSALLQIILSIVFLYLSMGPAVFAGVFVMIVLIPINACIAAISRRFQVRQMRHKDKRIKTMNEMLNGIKVIKLYAWEEHFKETVTGIRNQELKVLRNSAFLNAAASFTWTCAPFLVALATFATFVLIHLNDADQSPDNRLTADKAFVALSLFNILRFPLAMLPAVISMTVEASVSVKRLSKFLRQPELNPNNVDYSPRPPKDGEDAVSVTGASFTWDTPERPILQDINLHIRPGQLVGIVGQVGAGKSSLLSCLLGEMEKACGSVKIRGKVAYVPQQAWIQNNTVKDNILFGRRMEGDLYDQTIRACALGPDLDILPGGDMAEIGEKGINLSGGQKQRVSIARAVYQKADVYLLDDPLSAVDAHVGKHIFTEIVGPKGMLNGKTRILVTHGLSFLPQCDLIVTLNDGKIAEIGTYDELMGNNGAFAELVRTYAAGEDENEEGDPEVFDDDGEEVESELPLVDDEARIYSDASTATDNSINGIRRRHLERQRSNQFSREDAKSPGHSQKTLPPGSPVDVKKQLFRQLSRQRSVNEDKVQKEAALRDEKSKLITEEKAETGQVKLSVFANYAKATTWYMAIFIILFYVGIYGFQSGGSFWLAHWSNLEENNAKDTDTGLFLGVYGALGLGQSVMVLLAAFTMAIGAIFASRNLHRRILKNILRTPMTFFDTTPMGRILNRFSKDIYTVDETIPRSLRSFLMTFFSVITTIIVISISTPIFLAVIVPLLIIYIIIQRIYVRTSRQLKRLESVSRSPIYSHFQETLSGVSTIRAYRKSDDFITQSQNKVDYNQEAYYPGICANRWLAIRLEFLGNLIILFAALFAVLTADIPALSNSFFNAGVAGLSISYALQVTQALNWIVRMTSELETNIVAVERIKEYSESPTEAPMVIEGRRPPNEWPGEGKINIRDYSTRYREGLDLVLRRINCDIPGGQKVGIVGRTGAGKSSLTLGLFRIIEAANGAITIDGINIAEIGLYDLRSKVTIIPQDPVLFSDTLRANLDPFYLYSDEEVWRALETSHLKKFVSQLPDGLNHEVAEGGENLSVGQRQLVCLARALLRKTKILVLDEATAAIDMETDDLIQKTIRNEFIHCTVVTIAHRLNTIMDYDRIMVLQEGRIVEFDSPNQLINKKGLFYSMAKDARLL